MIITHWEPSDGPKLPDSTEHADRLNDALDELEAKRRQHVIEFDHDAWPAEVHNAYAAAVTLSAEPDANGATIATHMKTARPYLEALREAAGPERFRTNHAVGARLLTAFSSTCSKPQELQG